MNKLLIILITLCCSIVLSAQDVEWFVEMAVKHNPGLASMRLQYEAARESSNQVSDYPDPIVNLGIGVLPIETRLGAQRFRIGVRQEIPWKGLLSARKETKLYEAQTIELRDEVKKIDIAHAVRNAYNRLIYIKDQVDIINSKLQTLQIIKELAEASVRSGKGKLSNILLVQRTEESLRSDLLIINQRKEEPIIIINSWAGRPLYDSIAVTIPSILLGSQQELELFASQAHPSFQIIDRSIAASEKVIDLTQLERKPKIGVGLDYGWIDKRNDVENLSGNGRDVVMPVGSIKIPIHTDRFDSKRQEEKLKQEALTALKQDKKERYLSELAMARSQIQRSQLEIDKMSQLKEITTETIKLMETEYANTGTRFEELLRLEMELFDYELFIAQARYNILNAQAIMLQYQSLTHE